MQGMNEQGFYDIYPLWHVPFWQTTQFYIIVGIVSLLILTGITWLFIRWYFKKKAVPRTAWEVALDELRLLQHKKYQSKEDGKQCYFAMTSVLKKYLALRFAYPLTGKTDEEMVFYLAKSTDHTDLAHELKEIIDGCLYIKFANEQAMQENIMKHLEQSCAIVKKTMSSKVTQ